MRLTHRQKKQLCTEIASYFEKLEDSTQFGTKYKNSFVVDTGEGSKIGLAAYFSWHGRKGTFEHSYSLDDLTTFAIDMIKDKYRHMVVPVYSMDLIEADSAIEHLLEVKSRYERTIKEETESELESSAHLVSKINELETKLNALIGENVDLKERITNLEKQSDKPKPNQERRSFFSFPE